MASFETVTEQKRLKVRKAPYWHRLAMGEHLGVRKTATALHWQARAYDPVTQQETIRSLGDFGHLPAHERYSAAARAAREWFEHLGRGGRSERLTVADAWRRYIEHQQREKGDRPAADALARFARHVESDPIAAMTLDKLTAGHLKAWRERLSGRPAIQPKRGKHCRATTPQPPPKPRAASTVNRDLTPMRAALNLALADGFITSDYAWRTALAPTKAADGRRTLYLDRDQRRALIEHLPDDARAFVSALCLLPIRPGALATLTAGDFDRRTGTLHIRTDKAGEGRTIPIPAAAAELLTEQASTKLPTAPLLSRWDGSHWNKDAWKVPIKRAAKAAGLPPGTSAYTLRHSTITDLTSAGLDLFTVAAIAGTSVTMIEKHYGHLQQDRARDALAGLAL